MKRPNPWAATGPPKMVLGDGGELMCRHYYETKMFRRYIKMHREQGEGEGRGACPLGGDGVPGGSMLKNDYEAAACRNHLV